MRVRLVEEIAKSFETHGSEYAAAMADYSDRQIEASEFRRCWRTAYPRRGELTGAVQEKIVRRLLRLARFLRSRFWDFAIAERLRSPYEDVYTELAVRLLAHACAGREAELRFCIDRLQPLLPTVAQRHQGLFGEIELEMSTGLRPTPALSQAELARALDASYAQFRSDVRAQHWRPVPADRAKHQRRRQWRHAVPQKHAAALRRIRRRLPQRMWADLPCEPVNRAAGKMP